jgi:hypothetical protein
MQWLLIAIGAAGVAVSAILSWKGYSRMLANVRLLLAEARRVDAERVDKLLGQPKSLGSSLFGENKMLWLANEADVSGFGEGCVQLQAAAREACRAMNVATIPAFAGLAVVILLLALGVLGR